MVPAVVAQLTLSNIRMEVFSGSTASGEPWLWYAPRFRLTENSGLSGAVINRVVVRAPDGDTEEVDQLCWVRDIRVARGGVAEVFGDNAQDLVYCRPGLSYPIPIPFVLLEVTYADDNGRRATVVAQIATASAVAQF